ncbi:MAG: formylglycine-generating enzyme family protein [Deltaproteobacteria bacterium]|jgi:hypothetical protein|nr:formylglycine-generating enzyme family protein [Deltaproteobacteria bacterium]
MDREKTHVPDKLALILLASLALALLAAFPVPARAAIAKKGMVSPESVQNPKPDDLDLFLPMPCGLSMAFRAVALPVSGKVSDFETFLGSDADSDNAFLDNRHRVSLGSGLSLENLPEPMRSVAARALEGVSRDQVYLIGKYEVSEAQWDSVMGDGKCALSERSARPKAEISVFQAREFAGRYMDWLAGSRPEALPSFPDDPEAVGLVRLPTEEEWEYAARGGHKASTDDISTQPFFDLPDKADPREYGLFQSPGQTPEVEPGAIGRWKPNPLGLYDTAGNVAEMTSSHFRMTIDGRLHGSAGGFVRKGGSFGDNYDGVLPGKRIEVAHYYENGPALSKDLGLRLLVAAPVAVGPGARLEELRSIWAAPEPGPGPGQAPGPLEVDEARFAGVESLSPIEKVELLISTATGDEQRKLFESIKYDLKDLDLMNANKEQMAIRTNCRGLMFVVYSMHNTAKRRQDALADARMVEADLELLESLRGSAGPEQLRRIQDLVADNQKKHDRLKNQAEGFDQAISREFDHYLDLLGRHAGFDRRAVNGILRLIEQDIKGDDIYARAMRAAFQQVSRDLGRWRSGKTDMISVGNILENAI